MKEDKLRMWIDLCLLWFYIQSLSAFNHILSLDLYQTGAESVDIIDKIASVKNVTIKGNWQWKPNECSSGFRKELARLKIQCVYKQIHAEPISTQYWHRQKIEVNWSTKINSIENLK